MMRRDGRGTGRPNSVASSTQAATASWTAARAASAVSPSDMQPGKSGTSATNPPPSSSGSGSMMTGYSSFGIACFHHRVNEPNNLPDVNRLDWPTRGFVKSLLTQTLIIHIIRTAKIPFLESRASSALITTTIVCDLRGRNCTSVYGGRRCLGVYAASLALLAAAHRHVAVPFNPSSPRKAERVPRSSPRLSSFAWSELHFRLRR